MCLTCNTCFRRPIRVHNPNDISIGLAIFAQLTVECHRARLGMFFPLTIAPSHKDLDPHLIRGSLSPSDSVSQTASRSVQPFLHSSWQSVAILYNGPPLPSPSKLPLPTGTWTPFNTWFLVLMRAQNQIGISIGSAVFVQMTTEWPYTLQRDAPSPSKLPLPMGIWTPSMVPWVKPSSQPKHTDRQTTLLGR